jgi:predicted transposase YdaD
MVSERNEQIGHAADKLRILSNDQRARELYELRLKEWRDIESFKDDAYGAGYEKGEKSGYEKGEKKGAQVTASDIALKLMKLGRPIDEISVVTELSIKEIEQLCLAR